MNDIVLWGSTGQAIVIKDFLTETGYRIIAVFDNNPQVVSPFDEIPIYYGASEFKKWLSTTNSKQLGFIVSIGGDNGKERRAISEFLISHQLSPVSAIHPSTYIAKSVQLGIGIQIMSKACINARAIIGDYSIVNTASTIDHECELAKGVHIGPGSTLAGLVTIGEDAFVGAGSVILPRIHVGSNTIVGAGSVVTRDLPSNVIAYGTPAKVIRIKK